MKGQRLRNIVRTLFGPSQFPFGNKSNTSLRQWFAFMPSGRVRAAIVSRSWPTVLAYWGCAYVVLGLLFAGLYCLIESEPMTQMRPVYASDFIGPKPQDASTGFSNYLDVLHFAFTVQSTVGFGYHAPLGGVRFLTNVHSALGILMNTCLLGIIVIRITRRPNRFLVPTVVMWNPGSGGKNGSFSFRFFNREALALVNVKAKMFVIRPLSAETDALISSRTEEIQLDLVSSDVIPPTEAFAFRSCKVDHSSANVSGGGRLVQNASPYLLDPGTQISIQVSGVIEELGQVVHHEWVFKDTDVHCGEFLDMEIRRDTHRTRTPGSELETYDLTRLDRFVPMNSNCEFCDWRTSATGARECPLIARQVSERHLPTTMPPVRPGLGPSARDETG
ncbi:MAG: two pore domain potassium channel family protein [Planctomycetes bacterium]|nr:two pore domain potassium channel family protein [Planctomycetota bacterium]